VKKLYKTGPVEMADLARPGIRRGGRRYREATKVAEVTAGMVLTVAKDGEDRRAKNAGAVTTVAATGVLVRRRA
jgi:hypothetical protein